MSKGRPPKGQPAYHKAFGSNKRHAGYWRDCPECKAAYGRAWRATNYKQGIESSLLREPSMADNQCHERE
jgi:hypothetical protein